MDYLNQTDPPLGSIIKTTEFINLYRYMERDMDNVLEYYHHRERRVSNNHYLVMVIKHMLPMVETDIFTYIENIDRLLKSTLRAKHIASNVSKPKGIINGVTKGTITYFNHIELFSNYFNLKDWEYLSPLRPILTDSVDVNYTHPEHKLIKDITNIYEIDIKLMMVMYYYWSNERLDNNESIDVSIFVYQYVLTNSIPYETGHAIMNGFFNEGIDIKTKSNHPFVIFNVRKKLNVLLKKHRKKLRSKKSDYITLLHSIELPFVKNAYELYRTHNSFITSNNLTYTLMARSSLLINLFTFFKADSLRRNASFVREYERLIARANSLHQPLEEEFEIILETLTLLLDIKGE